LGYRPVRHSADPVINGNCVEVATVRRFVVRFVPAAVVVIVLTFYIRDTVSGSVMDLELCRAMQADGVGMNGKFGGASIALQYVRSDLDLANLLFASSVWNVVSFRQMA